MTEREINTVHVLYSADGSRPAIRVWSQANGNLKATQGTSWITWTTDELHQFVNAVAELRPDVLCDAPDDPPADLAVLGELFKSGDAQ